MPPCILGVRKGREKREKEKGGSQPKAGGVKPSGRLFFEGKNG